MIITQEIIDWIEEATKRVQAIGFGEITIRFLINDKKIRIKRIIEEGESIKQYKKTTIDK